ncbi:MAG: hypothetical protein IJW86_06900 [Clostridia bacterium]|nr:hypothetical protein [Clostridia bacterium]
MRKIVAVFVLLAIITVLFSACIGDEKPTTTAPISTGNVSTTQPTTTEPQPVSYILTTSPDKTVPWVETTQFDLAAVTTDFNIIIPSDTVAPPDVNISTTGSSLPATLPTSAPTGATLPTQTTTKPTTTKPTTTKPTTTEVEKFSTPLVVDSEAYDSNSGKLYLSISPASWSSDIKANTTSISIRIDGVTAPEKVSCSVTAGKNADGMQEIIIDLSGQAVTSGSTIAYTIPEGFLVSKAGTQFNSTYSSNVSF